MDRVPLHLPQHPFEEQAHRAHGADPPNGRVAGAGDVGDPLPVPGHVEPDALEGEGPLVPGALAHMGGGELAVVVVHVLLVLEQRPPHVPQAVALPEGGLIPVVGEIGSEIDGPGHQKEPETAPEGRDPQLLPEAGPLPLRPLVMALVGLEKGAQQMIEQHHRQARPRVTADPLAAAAQTEGHAREGQVLQLLPPGGGEVVPPHVLVHEEEHEQDEEHPVHVDGGDAGLGEVHAVEGPQARRHEGEVRALEDALGEHVHKGHHGHPEQGPHDPPAEGLHAEDQDAQGDDELAQRRVGPFIDGHVVDVLVGGTAVVDLVEDHAVEVAGGFRHRVLLVHQVQGAPVVAEHLQHRDGQQLPLREEGDLVESGLPILHRDPEVPGGEAHVHLMPLEHVPLVLGVGLLRAVVPLEAQGPLGHVPVEPDGVEGDHLPEVQGEAIPNLPPVDRGGEGQRAQVQKGDEGVQQRQSREQDPVQLQKALALPLLKEAQYLVFR